MYLNYIISDNKPPSAAASFKKLRYDVYVYTWQVFPILIYEASGALEVKCYSLSTLADFNETSFPDTGCHRGKFIRKKIRDLSPVWRGSSKERKVALVRTFQREWGRCVHPLSDASWRKTRSPLCERKSKRGPAGLRLAASKPLSIF